MPEAVTWSRVARLIEQHPAVKQVRLDADGHKVTVGFYEAPSSQTMERIQTAVRRELAGEWNVAPVPDGEWPALHLHKVDAHTAELHRTHPPNEPAVVWRRIPLPVWRNRRSQRAIPRDYRVMLTLATICGVTTFFGFILSRTTTFPAAIAICFSIAFISGAWFAVQDAWEELREWKIDIHFLMIAVAAGALFVRSWTEGATLLFLFSLSNSLEQFANHRTRRTIEALLKVAPKTALRRVGSDTWVDVLVEQVGCGDELWVKPGELFPVDGVVIEGTTSADESALTGESLPVAKRAGDPVSGGTLSIDGQTIIRVTRELQESGLTRILNMIELAQQQKAPAQRFTDQFSRYYTWVALSLGAAVFTTLLLRQHAFNDALYRAMTVLVVASPCALVLSIPSAILVAIAAGARRGILFRGGVAVENLAGVSLFAFDKTGTLTNGSLVVSRIVVFGSENEDSILKYAASVANSSTHPLARAIVAEARKRKVPLSTSNDFLNVPGLGMDASIGGQRFFVGSRRFMEHRGIRLPALQQTTEAEVWIGTTQPLGLISLRDEIRSEASGVIQFLKKSGFGVTLLTGDRAAPAALVASATNIDDVQAELSPQAKLEAIHRFRAAGHKVAMVGDGINDAPSLAAADVSIGMGARGSDAALEQADIVLMHDRIENVGEAVRLSSRARTVIFQNIAISLGVILVLIIAALMQKISLTTGVLGHEGSTVVVILNGLRLLGATNHSPAATAIVR